MGTQGERGWRRGMTLSGRELVVYLTVLLPGVLPDDLEFFFAMLGLEYADPKTTFSFNQLFLVRAHPQLASPTGKSLASRGVPP